MLDRRNMIATCASAMGLHAVRNSTWTAQAQERTVAMYQVDLNELVKAFPSRAGSSALPTLLSRFTVS
jgi:hypothetical protein